VIVYDSTVSERYARALFNVAKKQNTLAAIKDDAEQLLTLLQKDGKLAVFLEGPQFPTENKLALIKKLFTGKTSPVVTQLLDLLVKKDRIIYARPILSRFVELAEMDQGIRHAEVATAVSLSDDQKRTLQSALEKHLNTRLRLNWRTESKLIAGVRFTMGDLLIDDTVKGKLEKLRFQLQEASR